MRFAHTIPDPSELISGKERYQSIAAGTEVHRLHHSDYGATQFNDTELGNARFSPIRDSEGEVIPTIYAAATFEAATCEIILRCPDTPSTTSGGFVRDIVHPADFREYGHSILETTVDLELLDLTASGQRRIGVDHNVLLAGPRSTYPATRRWAERCHAAFPKAQGLYYLSYQAAPAVAMVLFQDRVPVSALTPRSSRRVAERPCHSEIAALAQQLSIDYAHV